MGWACRAAAKSGGTRQAEQLLWTGLMLAGMACQQSSRRMYCLLPLTTVCCDCCEHLHGLALPGHELTQAPCQAPIPRVY